MRISVFLGLSVCDLGHVLLIKRSNWEHSVLVAGTLTPAKTLPVSPVSGIPEESRLFAR